MEVSLPKKIKTISTGENTGEFIIEGCYPGYGTTLGNSLRRVLLSSLEGVAITAVKIKGVQHEFSTLKGVMEDVVQIILNLKKVRLSVENSDETWEASLKFKGEGVVTAKDFKLPSGIKVVNPEQVIATLTDKKAELEMDVKITRGLGYMPVEQQEKKEKEIGVIEIDAIYTPIKRVNYQVSNMRVGKRTDYDKIKLEIVTDGSINPEDAFNKAVDILVQQFSALKEINVADDLVEEDMEQTLLEEKEHQNKKEKDNQQQEKDALETLVVDLKNISKRTLNILEIAKIKKVKDLVAMTENDLKQIEGIGDKGVKEIRKAIGIFGFTLKQE